MFRVKICGITSVEDAIIAVEAGADAIGLNFYEMSPRCVAWHVAPRIVNVVGRATGDNVDCVGVLVNLPPDRLIALRRKRFALSSLQLHGDEPPSQVPLFCEVIDKSRATPGWNLIRARRFDDLGVAALASDLIECEKAGRRPDAVLVDAMTPGRYGGTGETVSWLGLADYKRWLGKTPLILAGGLTPDNVAEAIRIVRPAAVDVASGVESSPGRKDPVKVRDFVANALGAFEGLGGT